MECWDGLFRRQCWNTRERPLRLIEIETILSTLFLLRELFNSSRHAKLYQIIRIVLKYRSQKNAMMQSYSPVYKIAIPPTTYQ
jgi:hypothetical protein